MTDPQRGKQLSGRAGRDPAQFSSWQRVIESLIRVAGHHQDHGTYFEQGKANAYFDAASSVDLIRSNAVRVSSATSVPRPVIPATYTRSPVSIAGELVRLAPGRVLRFCAPERTGRPVSVGALYATLDRLVAKGYVAVRPGASETERGGRPKRFLSLRAAGVDALDASRHMLDRMWDGVELRRSTSG